MAANGGPGVTVTARRVGDFNLCADSDSDSTLTQTKEKKTGGRDVDRPRRTASHQKHEITSSRGRGLRRQSCTAALSTSLPRALSPAFQRKPPAPPVNSTGLCEPTASAVVRMPKTRNGCAPPWYLTSFAIGSGMK